MNNKNKNNTIIKLANRITFFNFKELTLLIYSIDYDTLIKIKPILEKHKGPCKYLSLNGKKDLILKSTGKPLPLLHIQFNNEIIRKDDITYAKPKKGYTYMFCCLKDSKLNEELSKHDLNTDISATIVHRNMDNCNWDFIMTSDI